MRESVIESYFATMIKDLGGMCIKLTPPPKGIPDRLVLFNGKSYFVEIKQDKGIVSEAQKIMRDTLRNQGFKVYTIFNTKDALDFVNTTLLNLRSGATVK